MAIWLGLHRMKTALLILRLAVGIVPVLLTLSCSTTAFFYGRSDTFLYLYVDRYVDFGRSQRTYFQGRADELLRIHCRTQLPRVVEFIGWLDRLASGPPPTDEQMRVLLTHLENLWESSVGLAVPAAAEVLSSLSHAQYEILRKHLSEDLDELIEYHADNSPADRREQYAEAFGKQFKRWFGSVSAAQMEAIHRWSELIQLGGDSRIAGRQNLTATILRTEQARDDHFVLVRLVKEVIISPENIWPPTYASTVAENKQTTLRALQALLRESSGEQRTFFSRKMAGVIADFGSVECS